MSACERCWVAASWKALMLGGSTAERYRDELAAHADGHADAMDAE